MLRADRFASDCTPVTGIVGSKRTPPLKYEYVRITALVWIGVTTYARGVRSWPQQISQRSKSAKSSPVRPIRKPASAHDSGSADAPQLPLLPVIRIVRKNPHSTSLGFPFAYLANKRRRVAIAPPAVEKGTRVVTLLNSSIFGERTSNNLQGRFLGRNTAKRVFQHLRRFATVTSSGRDPGVFCFRA